MSNLYKSIEKLPLSEGDKEEALQYIYENPSVATDLRYAWSWCDTPQGVGFWRKISEIQRKHYKW